MSEITRRDFIGRSLAGVGALMSAPVLTQAAESEEKKSSSAVRSVTDRVELGKTGIMVSRLGMGTGMHGYKHQSDHTRLGQAKFTELIRRGYDQGLNLFDMADLYGSHSFMKNALAGIPREKYALLTKIWFRKGEEFPPSGGAKEEVERFLKELGTDHLDVCLIHCVTDADWVEKLKRIQDELQELKQKKVVRAVGCSFHDHAAMKRAVDSPWVDLIFARINNVGAKMDGKPEEVSQTLNQARKNGKAILGMKIFGEGTLIKPEQKDASLKYVLGNNLVDAMSIGMLSTTEVDDSIARINQALKS